MSQLSNDSLERYSRQVRFHGVREAGQRKLLESRVTICGCGALGTVLANHMVRAGVGHVRIVDRDFIETHNLQPKFSSTNRTSPTISPKPKPPRGNSAQSTPRSKSSRS